MWGVASRILATEHDPYDHEGHALAEKAHAEIELSEAAQWESDVRWLMGHKRGRSIVFRIIAEANLFGSIFNANALQMARSAGEKESAFRFLGVINRRCPDHYTLMMKERHDDGIRTTDSTGVRTDQNSD